MFTNQQEKHKRKMGKALPGKSLKNMDHKLVK